MNFRRPAAALCVPFLAAALAAPLAGAQDYPSRPIKMLVGYAAGGANDNAARILAEGWQKVLGQPIVIENRPGASGTVAADAMSKMAPDGYNLMLGSGGTLTIAPHLSKVGFDTMRDIAGISLFAINEGALVVSKGFPAKNLKEFIEELKRNPGKYSFGSSGTGGPTHLAGELLKYRAGVDMVHIPYKGDAQGVTDLLGGTLPVMMVSIPSASAHIRAGTIRALGILSLTRTPDFPDIPTVAEQGYPGYSSILWIAPIAQAAVPAPIIARLNDATRRTVADPSIVKRMAAMGSRAEANSPEELRKFMQEEITKWGEIIRIAKVKAE